MDSHNAGALPTPPTDYLALLPRDPDFGIAWWGISADSMARGIERSSSFGGGTRLVLRIYTIEDDRQRARSHFREYPIDDWLGSRIVLLGRPGATLQAVVGLHDALGTFSPIVRSAQVQSPRTRPLASAQVAFTRVTSPDPPGSPLRSEPVDPSDLPRPTDESTADSAATGGSESP